MGLDSPGLPFDGKTAYWEVIIGHVFRGNKTHGFGQADLVETALETLGRNSL